MKIDYSALGISEESTREELMRIVGELAHALHMETVYRERAQAYMEELRADTIAWANKNHAEVLGYIKRDIEHAQHSSALRKIEESIKTGVYNA